MAMKLLLQFNFSVQNGDLKFEFRIQNELSIDGGVNTHSKSNSIKRSLMVLQLVPVSITERYKTKA